MVAKHKIQFEAAIRAIVNQRDFERGTGKLYRFDQFDAGRAVLLPWEALI